MTIAASLRHPFELQRPVRTADGRGGFTTTWRKISTLWGSLDPGSGTETIEGAGLRSSVTHTVRTRYRSDVSSEMRLALGDRLFQIESVIDETERKRWLRLEVAEGTL